MAFTPISTTRNSPNTVSLHEPQFGRKFLHPRYWVTWLGLGTGWLVAQLPFSLQIKIGRLIGMLMRKTSARRVHVARTNLTLCFPDKTDAEREQLLKKTFESIGIAVMETIMSWWAPDSKLKHRVTIDGLEHLETAVKKNNGVILLGAHYTTLEIAGKLLAPYASFDALYRKHKNPVFDYVMYKGRRNYCEKVIERGNMREMMRSLKQGRTIWYAPDQNYGAEHSVFVTFFNIPAATITATSRLAALNNSPVVPFSHERLQNNSGYVLRFYPALDNFPSEDTTADTQRINHLIENEILKMPGQYLWTHRRFKTRPKSLPPVY